MENVLFGVALYFVLPLAFYGLVAAFGALVDGLIWLVHGPAPAPPPPSPTAGRDACVPIKLAPLSPA